MSANHTLLGKVFHWAFVLLYAYGIFKQIDDLSQLEDAGLLQFEIVFASVFLLLVVIRTATCGVSKRSRAPSFRSTVTTSASHDSCTWRCISASSFFHSPDSPSPPSTAVASKTDLPWMRLLHGFSADMSYVLIAIHVVAALYSRIKGEGVWTSMVPVFTESGPSTNEYVVKAAALEHQALEKMEAFIAACESLERP